MRQWFKASAPPLRPIHRIDLLKARWQQLSNGTGICIIPSENQNIIKMEWLFYAGRYQEPQQAVAAAAAAMLMDGTRRRTQQQIADFVEYYGATLQADAYADYASLTLYALPRYVGELVPLMTELITEAIYPEQELEVYRQQKRQRLMVELQRVEFLAQRAFQQRLFGEQHPLGYVTDFSDLDKLTSEGLQQFHRQVYAFGPFYIVLAGSVDDRHVTLLEQAISGLGKVCPDKSKVMQVATQPAKVHLAKEDAVQVALRVGRRMVNRLHPDYNKLVVLNTILGGYFGSRLMQSLREEHGYCYGVHSSLVSFRHDAYLCISTEVGKEVASAAIAEIYRQVQRLRTELVETDELLLVKNYLMGALLADTDGALNTADVYRNLILFGQKEEDFHERVRQIREIQAEELLQLAQAYLDPEQMVEVAAGM